MPNSLSLALATLLTLALGGALILAASLLAILAAWATMAPSNGGIL